MTAQACNKMCLRREPDPLLLLRACSRPIRVDGATCPLGSPNRRVSDLIEYVNDDTLGFAGKYIQAWGQKSWPWMTRELGSSALTFQHHQLVRGPARFVTKQGLSASTGCLLLPHS